MLSVVASRTKPTSGWPAAGNGGKCCPQERNGAACSCNGNANPLNNTNIYRNTQIHQILKNCCKFLNKDKRIFVIGGINQQFAAAQQRRLKTVVAFNGVRWVDAPSLLTTRSDHSAVVFQGKLYVIGGINRLGERLDTVDVFDGERWKASFPMSTKRINFAAVVFQDKLYAIGGEEENFGNSIATVEVFDGVRWSQTPSMPTPRSSFAAVVM